MRDTVQKALATTRISSPGYLKCLNARHRLYYGWRAYITKIGDEELYKRRLIKYKKKFFPLSSPSHHIAYINIYFNALPVRAFDLSRKKQKHFR